MNLGKAHIQILLDYTDQHYAHLTLRNTIILVPQCCHPEYASEFGDLISIYQMPEEGHRSMPGRLNHSLPSHVAVPEIGFWQDKLQRTIFSECRLPQATH